MNATLCNTILLASLLCGCSTTYTIVEPGSRNPYTKAQFTNRILDNEVTVEFTDGNEADAMLFQVGGDSCIWIDPTTGLSHQVRTRDIKTVVARNYLLGALEGLGIGILAGGTVGIVFGRLTVGPYTGDLGSVGAVLYFAGGSLLGALVGTVYGAIAGHEYEYEFVWFSKRASSKAEKKDRPEEKSEEERN